MGVTILDSGCLKSRKSGWRATFGVTFSVQLYWVGKGVGGVVNLNYSVYDTYDNDGMVIQISCLTSRLVGGARRLKNWPSFKGDQIQAQRWHSNTWMPGSTAGHYLGNTGFSLSVQMPTGKGRLRTMWLVEIKLKGWEIMQKLHKFDHVDSNTVCAVQIFFMWIRHWNDNDIDKNGNFYNTSKGERS